MFGITYVQQQDMIRIKTIHGWQSNPFLKTTIFCSLLISNMWFLLPIALLILQSIVAIHRSWNDMRTVSFIIGANADIGLLLWSIGAHEKSPVGSKQREKLKIFIWLLATLLNVGLAYRVTMMMPFMVSLVLWVLVAFTTIVTFHLFFLLPDQRA
ncbi:hypothetical protein QJS10_CPA09g01108 [Acorus calamus]|uniref:Uncharacterized protein n=1 Tax=Acorus calamus TaxID=4465 RepID=A0AAV9E4K8_ACOCL|nr:hypothetical protein QJS10_CPA09g01108 [Acorus calamus]